jgi:ABC-2 type transport system permease protein
MIQIFKKEINSFLNSIIAYIVISVFLAVIGLFMWIFPDTSVLNYGFADMDTLFSFGPYVLMFLVPAITMRMLAEERKSGTMELLLTKPLTDLEIILGKFLAGFALVFFSIAPTVIYYFSISSLGNPPGNIDTAGVIGSYIGLLLLGMIFTAIGLFASSLNDNQVVSFILAIFLCFLFFSGFDYISALATRGTLATLIEKTGILYHYHFLSKGLIDAGNVIYFISITALMIFLTKFVLSSRKW